MRKSFAIIAFKKVSLDWISGNGIPKSKESFQAARLKPIPLGINERARATPPCES
jgi:hypothetical protein